MIKNFEEITCPLTEEELSLVKVLVAGFRNRDKDNPIKAPQIIAAINKDRTKYNLSQKFTGPRLRKIANYIRANGIIPLIATSKGYYCSNDWQEIGDQIYSMQQRADAILRAANGLELYRNSNVTAPLL